MSYTVLARKWRPRVFAELVGQEHVVQALVNSLSAERVHHAYLFSGTRGVGKTTVARILAKALNCDSGIVAEPCGECAACTAIDEGRFVDLIEVDAASRTKVDDTRELLDNVQYAPTQGRFKVYLIDEVHMLSKHSFNALLKTLEEPPPHVKFLLATTDPQKLPVTVLSRCLQFNLKKLSHAQIKRQLARICESESVEAEPAGLEELARAAAGSMRDALSLLDQAIAFAGGTVTKQSTDAMLGTIDRSHVIRLLEGLASSNGSSLLDEVASLDEFAPDYASVLDELMGELQRIAVVQLVGYDANRTDLPALRELADSMSPEDVQLFYQIALQSRRDIDASRDARSNFEMTLLRMLAFRPVADAGNRAERSTGASGSKTRPEARPKIELSSAAKGAVEKTPKIVSVQPIMGDWDALLRDAEIHGAARQLAEHCTIKSQATDRVSLVVTEASAHLNTDHVRKQLESALTNHLGRRLVLDISAGSPPVATPAQIREAGETQKMRKAREAIEQDPNVKAVQAAFDAVVEADSVSPAEN
ncbi:MAG TPA: DNA polymerase III subunit gamma/tau [Gammaproteobacteria bacterium]